MNITTKKVGMNVVKNFPVMSALSRFMPKDLKINACVIKPLPGCNLAVNKAMRNSEIKLTKEELDFSASTRYPLLKHSIVTRINTRFELLGEILRRELEPYHLPGDNSFKITRGDNYRLMPYLILDYPRISSKEFPVLFRTMFWWGHFYSLNMLVRNDFVNSREFIGTLQGSGLKKLKLFTGNDLWEQDLDLDAFVSLKTCDLESLGGKDRLLAYTRIGKKVTFGRQEKLEKKAVELYKEACVVLGKLRAQ
jgi:hypothetical protein